MVMKFEWDARKARSNLQRHHIDFEEAKTVFNDPFLMTFPDHDHSDGEYRYLSIGHSASGRTLVIIHTDTQLAVRIISCREATRKEKRAYEEGDV
ncbi:hypothetical protein U27_06456 [Candidatus Vecturithrix granuli]|uniref:BrnT family toxin n=1 Tax=Vecturithrix granuli TaxID=1499967 RepID=A0A081C4G6_VECG1|nr:hypothetical protein U27_06456 [Candidatus Vecturithrix granuli]